MSAKKMSPEQAACPHREWAPVVGEMGRYQCGACGVYGRRVFGNPLPVPWANGQLRGASSRTFSRRRKPGEGREAANELSDAPRPFPSKKPQPGEEFIEPIPETEHA